MYELYRKQILPISIDQAWEFFKNPHNLGKITPAHMGFRILNEVESPMFEGQIIKYKIAPFPGMPLDWMTEITKIREPFFFIDEQRHGPYKVWHHEHWFKEVEQGVEMIDRVNYVLPFGPLGKLVHALIVKRQLQQIFAYRNKRLIEIFGTVGEK